MTSLQLLGEKLAKATLRQFAKALLWIEDEEGRLVKFIFNEAQEVVYKEIRRQQKAGRPVRLLILKGRQQGMSTFCQMMLLWLMLTRPGIRTLTVGHNLAAVHELYNKFDRGVRQLPDFIRPDYEPGGERNRRQRFADPLRSSYRADSAHDPEGVGRGTTIQAAHLTEIPQWSKPEETMQAVLATIPDSPGSVVLVETTAKGAAGWFFEAWTESSRKMAAGEEPEFVPVFVPWYKTKRYKRKPRPGEPRLSKREQKRRDDHGLTNDQMYWYRDQTEKYGERVAEEYPFTAAEAFLSSGRPFLRREHMNHYRENRRIHLKRGTFVPNLKTKTAKWSDDVDGETFIYEVPDPKNRYSVGVDFASGRAKDFSAIVVLDIDTKRVVATHKSKMLPDEVLVQAICLGRKYNEAIIVPERSGIGQTLVDRLTGEYAYPNVFRPTDGTAVRASRGARFGFATSNATRKWLLEEMAHYIHTQTIAIPCTHLVDELGTMIYSDDEGEHAEAAAGSHDDLVFAFAFAIRGFATAPMQSPKTATPRHKRPAISSRTGY